MGSIRIAKVKSRVYSIYDGLFYSIMVGSGETYFSAFAVFLGANNFQLGVLSALPAFLGGLSQLWTVSLLKRIRSRRKMVVRGVLIQTLALTPLVFTYYLPGIRLELMIFLVCLYMVAGSIVAPVWNSWIGDLVDGRNRGGYFGKRNRIVTLGTYISMTAAGFLLKYFEVRQITFWGFAFVISVASFSRVISAYFLSKKHDPPGHFIPANRETFLFFIRHLMKKPYGWLILYLGLVNFSVYLSAAYFTPYLLKDLKWDYTTYTLVIGGTTLMKFFTSPLWGRLIDQRGAKSILLMTGTFITFVTLPWVFSASPVVILMAQMYGGFVWAGWELASFTLLLEAIPPDKRAQDVGYFNIINGACALAGGVVGSLVVDHGPFFMHAFGFIYCLSAAARLCVVLGLAGKISETPLYEIVRANSLLLGAAVYRSAMGGLQLRPILFPIKKTTRQIRRQTGTYFRPFKKAVHLPARRPKVEKEALR